jgi:glycosidase
MPQLVLLAKNVHVWLSQLTEKYGTPITTLSDIPDQELDELTLRGFTGLWLVGIWERSTASQTIKRAMGSTDAMASAYSIYDYSVAKDLGGQESFDELKSRLLQRGIRLGADMVPNHTGISSKWVLEHPEWFISTPSKPFPSYSYESHNLSDSDKIEIILEDHYYDQTDAAVTFKRIDKETGEEIYIYHGNDGTSYPWNDTAQIDFLNPEAREAVIEAIVNVAKQFPIIRFDAAMVLAKQHIRRLWYPTPGEGGDIPSRSQYSLSDEDFTSLIPNEFWREVVDRVNSEAPDTLLLAEAFWLLEGYFVRTLGMHRVYNSAFLKMLKDEQNYEYRQTIKNVLEYDPGILKRFVNYLTTPDETPAVVELGTGDKYFGLATMMVTMPGLPMFGHGQFEGYSEKYGMEYSRAYYDEGEDLWLIERHEREIVPLIKKRYLFAESKNFYLYDFFSKDGDVNENVFCYSNRYNDEKGLIIYNNKFEGASGWLKRSVAFSEKRDDLTTRLRQIDLFEGLNLDNSLGYLIFTDAVTQLQYIRSKDELREDGLFVSLGAFQYHVFLDMYEVEGEDQLWDQIVADLGGQGTEDLQTLYETLREDQNTPLEPASTHKGDTRSELDKLRDRIIQLQEKLIQHEEQEEIIAHLTVQVELLDQKESEIKSLQTLLKERDATIQSLQDKLNSSLPENSHLVEENESLKKEIENLQDKLNTTSPAGDDLSTILLGKILARLETLPNGIYLRNLAMSLGISSNLCLEHVMVLVNDGKLSIQRKREDDHNPKVLLSSDRK